jgi:hypothetical protein
MGDLLVIDDEYSIKIRGTIYLSFYTYVNSWELNIDDQGIDLKGNWSITWTSYNFKTHHTTGKTYEGDFEDMPDEVFSINNTRFRDNFKIALAYFVIEAENYVDLEVHYELDLRSKVLILPTLDILIIPKITWFPSWIELFVVTVTILSLFLSWEKKGVIKSRNYNQRRRRE